MITEKQIEIVGKHLGNYLIPDGMNDELIRNMLEESISEYEKSKWIKFDANDESTWPEDGVFILTNEEQTVWFDVSDKKFRADRMHPYDFTHWQQLPKPPTEK